MSETITVSVIVKAPLATVWDALNQPEHITRWSFASDDWHCPHATNDLRVGGLLSSRMEARDGSMGFDFGGVYTRVVPPQALAYRMGDGRMVSVELQALPEGQTPEGQTQVTETFDAEATHPAEAQRAGWQAILDNFKKYVETLG